MIRRIYSLREIAPPAPAITTPVGEKVWLLNLDQIEPHTGILLNKEYVERSRIGTSTHTFDDGNVLYSKLRPYLNKVLLPDIAGYCTSELVPMRPNQAIVTREYLAAYLRCPAFLHWVSQQVDGAKMPRVSMKVLWEHRIKLPGLDEQKHITSILDKADSLRRKRQEAVLLADEFLRAVFIDMFGDPVANPKGWQVKRLADLGSLDRGISKHRPRNDPSLLGGAHPLIQTGEVANCDGYIRSYTSTYSDKGLLQSKLWPTGTLCITIAANIAKTGILLFPACFPDSVVGFTASTHATVEYVRFWLSFLQKTLEANAPESAQKNINLAILRDLQVPVPPIDLILKFADIVSATESIRIEQRKALQESHALLSSLQHELLA
ncbi:restriction endonuclease subunit S [Pseudoduganella sp. OTU4001]|uniref:restriction endonuclease subunit S n=1 Tax=Pseudoduganella sp. OTU4001 TaxID=3043854 RepID=UPI00313AE121